MTIQSNHTRLKKNIALIGFSATGKSTVSRKIAEHLNWNCIDTDDEIVKITGKTVAEIFKQDGEETFRELETFVLNEACSKENVVLATGGGILNKLENMDKLVNTSIIILLDATAETIYQRLLQDTTYSSDHIERPLLTGDDQLGQILKLKASRITYYQIADWTIHTDNLSLEDVCNEAIKGWEYICRKKSKFYKKDNSEIVTMVNAPSKTYPVIIGRDIVKSIGNRISEYGLTGKIITISDYTVAQLYGQDIFHSLTAAGYKVLQHRLPAGERSKSAKCLFEIYEFLINNHVERGDLIISLGGGMVGDITGYAAATYLRGLSWIQVPTTLIGMVDASIGGKTAINHSLGKNLIGSFYQPCFVFVDINTLKTLPRREMMSGWAEVIKYGLIEDPKLFQSIEENAEKLIELAPDITLDVINQCINIKASIVSLDEREMFGKRIVLNYGHTIGHGIEVATKYKRFLHGEAISIGMIAAAQISERMGFLSSHVVERHSRILKKFNLPVNCHGLSQSKIVNAMRLDKKASNNLIKWVLLKDIGKTSILQNIPEPLVNNVLEGLLHH